MYVIYIEAENRIKINGEIKTEWNFRFDSIRFSSLFFRVLNAATGANY